MRGLAVAAFLCSLPVTAHAQTDAAAWLEEAQRQEQSGHRDAAVRAGQQAIALMEAARRGPAPSYDLEYNLALACFHYGDLAKAAQYGVVLVERFPEAEAFNLLAHIEEKRGRYLEAVRAFQRAANLAPRNEDYRFDYGLELLQHNNTEAAIAVFAGGAADFPESWRMRLGLGCAHYVAGAFPEAAKALLGALKIQPRIPLAYRVLGGMYEFAGSDQKAIRDAFAAYLKSAPRDPWAYYHHGRIEYFEAQSAEPPEYAAAKLSLTRAVELKPDLAEGHVQLGTICQDEEHLEESIRYFREAARIDPELAEAHYRLGLSYRRLGQDKLAMSEFELHSKLKSRPREDSERRAVVQFLIQGRQ